MSKRNELLELFMSTLADEDRARARQKTEPLFDEVNVSDLFDLSDWDDEPTQEYLR